GFIPEKVSNQIGILPVLLHLGRKLQRSVSILGREHVGKVTIQQGRGRGEIGQRQNIRHSGPLDEVTIGPVADRIESPPAQETSGHFLPSFFPLSPESTDQIDGEKTDLSKPTIDREG